MFEALEARVRHSAEARAVAVVHELAARDVPEGVRIGAEGNRVLMSGRGLLRRMASEAMLRWWRL